MTIKFSIIDSNFKIQKILLRSSSTALKSEIMLTNSQKSFSLTDHAVDHNHYDILHLIFSKYLHYKHFCLRQAYQEIASGNISIACNRCLGRDGSLLAAHREILLN